MMHGLSCNCFNIGMLKMQGYYLCNIQVENIVVMPLWAIVSNILPATMYFIIIFLSFELLV